MSSVGKHRICLCLFSRNRYLNNIADMTYGDGGQCFNQDYFQLFAVFTIKNHILYLVKATRNVEHAEERCFL